jgi:hemerythrin
MPLMPWTPLFSVGIREIDEQHKLLFKLANEFDEACRTGDASDSVWRVLDELIRYTEFHFSTEERLMERLQYSVAESHRIEHVELRRSVEEFRSRLQDGSLDLQPEILGFFRDWLTRHIMNSDRQLGAELGRKGLR